ncbi:MAG: (deoxy)nucleoside triphosphate pyrophosphohydrolase [Desulfobacteraceae bacterium]|nr:(deoxy)nucleoside triphosphate pyrophosphohydrolase [Desulfobacteraceae bacterium]MCB9495132.1 (deoxy)nucleoside triphosphate pyrophosphohydrolase [Desulfobacteraceae bacterium]
MITVCAAIIFNEKKERILIGRRKSGEFKGYWEFPGGKLEAGETPEDCILRELEEELCARSEIVSFFHEVIHEYKSKKIKLVFFEVRLIDQKLCTNDHDIVIWEKPSEFKNYKFPEADLKIIEMLNQS